MNALPLTRSKRPATRAGEMAKLSGARKPLRGLQADAYVVDMLDRIVAAEREANALNGATSKTSVSDLVDDALADWVSRWLQRHGPVPTESAERKAFVKKLAAAKSADAEAQLLSRKIS